MSAQAIGITTAPAKVDLEVAEPNFCRPSTSTHCDCAPTVAPLRSETNSRRLIVPSRQDNDHRTDKSPYLGRDDPEAQGPLMGWSGRAPAPPARECWEGASR